MPSFKSILSKTKPLLPIVDGTFPPALTSGLSVFLVLLYLINIYMDSKLFNAISLYSHAPLELELNRLSMYPLGHANTFHLVMNIFAMIGPLSKFEVGHGTVHTGVVLNALAVVTALIYCVLSGFFYPGARVLGASAWWFSFAGFFAQRESVNRPHIHLFSNFVIPTIFSPLVPLVIITILFPSGASFIGHVAGLLAGYLLAFGYLKFMVPPSKVIEFIESKVDFLINLIPSRIRYYRERDVKPIRDDSSSYVPMFIENSVLLTTNPLVASPSEQSGFPGAGQALGV
ncbi:hypothetical protein BABINDRAFT_159473 [Babjeviella inositovora NRRL Y-12698]|uniref:Rhomboid-type serine protease 2 n=1 Tax=Babjeviella inositovora NRRL Y-12698 TaxID=984486 RepID=A0A1E3QZE5_9ASCO|nr:uncharacterized protein BABINDRAFT_159473 [Babjeviella inositovora NRRL Y-12698]ODQ82995.1 hypothetical protein BABINDRAFT_159473 [Babjeviella inositovora NRRL Y-12698]